MERFRTFIYILLGILLWGCDSQPLPTNLPKDIGSIRSRDALSDTTLPEGSQALFNASGGFTFADQIFAFANSRWTNAEVSLEPSNPQETTLTALYPAYNGEQELITQNPYSGNVLEDVLIAQSKFTAPTEIELKFKHLFAMLTIHVASTIKESLTEVSLKAPKIESINGLDGSFTTSGEHTSTLPKNESGDYSFILPPMENCNLTLSFKTSDENEVSYPLTHSFISGYKYECNVIDEDTRPGIRTANDLIDFSLLINGDLAEENWSRFGYKEGEDTIYCLLNDITLSEEENKKFPSIGNHFQSPFAAIFDGKGHTISGINISAHNGTAGFFGRITSTGIIKNIRLNNSSLSINGSASSGVGLLAGVCYGTITNCSATNSTIYVDQTYPTGGLIGHLRAGGKILNSCVQNTTITSEGYIGGLAGEVNQGNILNCYVASNRIKGSTSCGGMVGNANQCNITNCYKYNIIFDASKCGQIIGKGANSTIDHIFYDLNNQKLILDKTNETCTQTNYKQYNTNDFKTTEDNIEIYRLLNQWINNQGTVSNLFTLWKSKDDLPAVFQ